MRQVVVGSFRTAIGIGLLALVSVAWAEISITLKNTFIDKFKSRATIDTQFVVDHTKGKPNSPSKDGDMHIAGRDGQNIGMAAVAELMNAKEHLDAVQAANDAQGTNAPIAITGVWRIWNEHGGDNAFEQGKVVAAATTSNPDHVFEVHPVTRISDLTLLDSLKPIQGYETKEPDIAFPMYEQVRSSITRGNGTTTIVSNGIGYNYVKFQMVLNERPFAIQDGALVQAKVQDLEGHLLLRNKRMVFVKDSEPHRRVSSMADGDCMVVLGIPRINLSLVAWRTAHASDARKPLTWNLPYEMVVVGAYDEQCEDD